MNLKKAVGCLLMLFAFTCAAQAATTHFTETVPPASPGGAIPVANGYDWSLTTNNVNTVPPLVLPSYTVLVTSNTLQSTTTGQLIFCTNCTNFMGGLGQVCFSTGTTTVGQFVAISSAAAVTSCK